MTATVWVKVVGFSDVERHTLNTLFRLSAGQTPAYALWTPEQAAPPQVALIDVDSYESGLDQASPGFNTNLKRLCVGSRVSEAAWRTFPRPVDWPALLQALDSLFASQAEVDIDLGLDDPVDPTVPPGIKASLLVGLAREEALYLRARLALAGLTDVDDADSAVHAGNCLAERRYDLVVVSLELADADPWALVQSFADLLAPPHAVVVATAAPSWQAMERAEALGCKGLLEVPFNPPQVLALLQQV
jgi:CheY-like chemotaxis protein